MTVSITQDVKPNVEIIFYVKEGNASPYQGRLVITQDDYATLTPDDIEAAQINQYNAWKANLVALQNAPPPDPSIVPVQITALQARRAIAAAGLLDAVTAAINAADDSVKALWYQSEYIERANPVLNAMATQIGMSSEQLDDLFRAGALL